MTHFKYLWIYGFILDYHCYGRICRLSGYELKNPAKSVELVKSFWNRPTIGGPWDSNKHVVKMEVLMGKP